MGSLLGPSQQSTKIKIIKKLEIKNHSADIHRQNCG